MPTKEEKVAKQKIANAKAKVRTLMIAGKVAEAEAYAASQGFDVFSARLAPEYQSPAEPAFAAYEASKNAPVAATVAAPAEVDLGDEAPPAVPDAVAEPETINGWPVLSEAVVWGIPPNKSMVVIELPDRRRVSMWRTRNVQYRIHGRLNVRIAKTEGDPIYEQVAGARPAF